MNNFIDKDKINFFYEDISDFPFPDDIIRKWIFLIIEQEKKICGELNFIFTSDEYLLQVNVEYLQHDYLTDIITFDYSQETDNVIGDIFISIDRISDNSKEFENKFEEEFCRIIAHGVLHIIGYTDKQPEQKNIMTSKEDYYLSFVNHNEFLISLQ